MALLRVSDKLSHAIPDPPPGECWIWDTDLTSAGYGRITVDGQRYYAHRWFYEKLIGPIPRGLQIDHLCRVRNCVNVDHLELVTIAQNVRRGKSPSMIALRAGVCGRGHAKTPENMYQRKDRPGKRQCRPCERIRERARRSRR